MDNSGPFLFSELFCGTSPSCLKVKGWWVGGWWPTGFYCQPQSPLGQFGFELGWTELGLGLGGLGTRGTRVWD